MKSDFGRGLTYCLGLFATHFDNNQMGDIDNIRNLLAHTGKDRKVILGGDPPPNLNYGKAMENAVWWYKNIVPIYGTTERALSSSITTWANGATDHLYEMEVPEKWKGTKIDKKVSNLRDVGLAMGHGFKDKTYTIEDVNKLRKLTKEIFFLVDESIGLKPVKAIWGEIK